MFDVYLFSYLRVKNYFFRNVLSVKGLIKQIIALIYHLMNSTFYDAISSTIRSKSICARASFSILGRDSFDPFL